MVLQPETVSTIIKQFELLSKQSEKPLGGSIMLKGRDRLPAMLAHLENPDGSSERQQLHALIESLSWEEKGELTAIFWVGRDYPEVDAETFNSWVERAKRQDLDDTADYLLSKFPSLVAKWLAKGLAIACSF